MTIEVYIADDYFVSQYDGHIENDRVLSFADKGGVRYIGTSTPSFFPSIRSHLEQMTIGEITIEEDL